MDFAHTKSGRFLIKASKKIEPKLKLACQLKKLVNTYIMTLCNTDSKGDEEWSDSDEDYMPAGTEAQDVVMGSQGEIRR